MSVIKAIRKATSQFEERGWDSLYWAIDLHGTISSNQNYSSDDLSIHYYPFAKESLQLLSTIPHVKLILYTCSHEQNIKYILELMKKDGINFHFFNENPEAKNTEYGDYSRKLYFNVLLDDKAGFDPEEDWEIIYENLLPYKYYRIYSPRIKADIGSCNIKTPQDKEYILEQDPGCELIEITKEEFEEISNE